MTFEEWMKKVNQLMASKVGVGVYDIADWTYRDAFDDGYTPEEAAEEAFNADDTAWLMGLTWDQL